MHNRYYRMPKAQKRLIKLKIVGIALAFGAVVALLFLAISISLVPLVFLVLALSLSVLAPFFDVPSMVASGKMQYLSLFLLSEKAGEGKRRLHGGTLFDYYFTLPEKWNGRQRKTLILYEYLKGLLYLIEHEHDETVVEGTSYFISEQTAAKLGLRKAKTDWVQKLILMYNYLNLTLTLSYAKKSLQWPDMRTIHTFRAKVADIRAHEQRLRALINRMEKARWPAA